MNLVSADLGSLARSAIQAPSPLETSSPANLKNAGLDEAILGGAGVASSDARPGPARCVWSSTGRGARLRRLFGVGFDETITNLPIPWDVEGEEGQVCTDGRSEDRGDESKEPFSGVEAQPRTDEGASCGARGTGISTGVIVAGVLGSWSRHRSGWRTSTSFRCADGRCSRSGAARTALARDVYTYLHLPMVVGIVLFALAMKKTLAHVGDELDTIPALGAGTVSTWSITGPRKRKCTNRTVEADPRNRALEATRVQSG